MVEGNENKKSVRFGGHRRQCLNFSSECRKLDVWQLQGRELGRSHGTSENNPLSLTALVLLVDGICLLERVSGIWNLAKSICHESDTGMARLTIVGR